jgi:hypothetical protein
VTIEAGHEVLKERPKETNRALDEWLLSRLAALR